MARADIPEDVRRLVGERLPSVSHVEILLLLRALPDKAWTAEEVARAQTTRVPAAVGFLEHLHEAGLVSREDDRYRYAAQRAATVDALADCYTSRRHAVVSLIFAEPDDSATSLADAFRLRRKKS